MSWRARVAERARVSSRGSAASRPRNWAWAGLGTVMGSRSSAAAACRYLKNELSEAIRRLRVLGAAPSATSWSRQAWTSATEVCKR